MTHSSRRNLRVAEIISTKKRKEILKVIQDLDQRGYFSVPDLCKNLKAKRVEIKVTTVLNVVKSLHFAGFLAEKLEEKKVKVGGRAKNLYRIVE
jgi:Fe2+ or Zn2+ uptake regulation protein